MISRRVLRAATLAATLFAGGGRAEEPKIPFELDNHAFRFILGEMRLQPLPEIHSAASDPSRTLLIFLGETDGLARVPGGLADFLKKGGAVLVATDRPSDPALEEALGVYVHGPGRRGEGMVAVIKDPALHAYRGSPYCPFVVPTNASHPVMLGLKHVATNRPSYLGRAWRLSVLADLPTDDGQSLPEGFPANRRNVNTYRGHLHFAAGGDVGPGRALVLSDHSVFINDMMLQQAGDNDNFAFAYNCVRWLTDGGRRDRVWFEYEGMPVTDFDVALPPTGHLPELTPDLIDKLGAAVEDDDLFNRMLAEHLPARYVLGALAGALAVVVLFYGLHRAGRERREADPELASLNAAPVIDAAGPVGQRHEAMMCDGNLWEAARDRARQALADAGWAPDGPPARVPAEASWRQRRALRDLAESVRAWAEGRRSGRVSPRRFAQLTAEVEKFEAARRDGRLRFEDPGRGA